MHLNIDLFSTALLLYFFRCAANPAGGSKMARTDENEAHEISSTEHVTVPEIGALVRCRTSLLRSPRRTSGRVKAVISQEYGPTVVIESIWGDEVTVTVSEYCRFFEVCDPRDMARQYWEGT